MNTMSNRRTFRGFQAIASVAALAGLAVFVTACATTPPPTEQVAVSTAAVSRAANAGAGDSAPAEIRTAREKLDRAKSAMAANNNDEALSLAEEAQVDAQLAESKARSAKARKAADEVNEGARVLREELNRKTN